MSAKIPEVSVVIPCYNGERFVSDAIESVLKQTFPDLEVLVVDDGSKDGSVKIVEDFLADERVRLLQHGVNRGIAAARNTAIKNARGRYIGFLDQDDLWREDKLALQLDLFEKEKNKQVAVVFSRVETVSLNNGPRPRRDVKVPRNISSLGPDELLSRLLLSDFVSIGSALIRRECFETVGLLDEDIRSGSDDFELLIRLGQRYKFACVDQPLTVRRYHEGNFTDAAKMAPDALKVLETVVAARPGLARVGGKARSRFLYLMARALHARGERARAKEAYKDAIRARPLRFKPVMALVLCWSGRIGDALLERVNRI